MSEIHIYSEVNAPASHVWHLMADFGGVARWNPNLKDAFLLEGSSNTGIGARRQCNLKDGKNYLREEIVGYEEGKSLTISVYDGTMPLSAARLTASIEERGDACCQIRFSMNYEARPGILGALMATMARPMMRGLLKKAQRGLAREAEAHGLASTPQRAA